MLSRSKCCSTTSIKGRAHTHGVDFDSWTVVRLADMSPTLNRSSALQHFERGNAAEIRNRIMLDFYPGLPHIRVLWQSWVETHGFDMVAVPDNRLMIKTTFI